MTSSAPPSVTDFDVLIIGSGFAGLCLAIQLRKSGRQSFAILERNDDIGGTWRDNTYPGCACDVPSHLYSLSFEPYAGWSRMYPSQPEIWAYLQRCVDKYRLRPSIRFNCEMREAVFDEDAQLWRVHTLRGVTLTARILVSAMGGLSRPSYPRLPGLERFQGKAFHSASWDHSYDLQGKRVAVIGTGASAIQFVPQIVPQVARLSLFQRTPPWVIPRRDRPFRPWELFLFKRLPGYRWMVRQIIYWRQEMLALGFTVHPRFMKLLEKLALRSLKRKVPDPELREKVTPHYMPGCKRLLISNDYLPALSHPNLELITDDITEIREHSIVTRDGREREVDALIYGTGFRATDLLTPIRIVGRHGMDLNEVWRDGAEAYFGMAVTGCPNLFLLVGPNTGLGHNSIVFMIETQVNYIMQCLNLLRTRGLATMEVRADVQSRFNQKLQQEMQHTVWASGCKSWYQDGHGKNTTLWPGFTYRYWMETRRVRLDDYLLERLPENKGTSPSNGNPTASPNIKNV